MRYVAIGALVVAACGGLYGDHAPDAGDGAPADECSAISERASMKC